MTSTLSRGRPLLLAVGLLCVSALPALASTPADSGTLTAPTTAGSVTKTWTGTAAGANPVGGNCAGAPTTTGQDGHTFSVAIPGNLPAGAVVTLSVTETSATNDTMLDLDDSTGKVIQSSDKGGPGATESVTLTSPAAASYNAVTCSYSGAGAYDASATLTTTLPSTGGTLGGTSTTAGPATFGNYSLASVPGTNQSGEPSIGVDWQTGNVYFQANLNTVKAVFPDYSTTSQPALTDVTCFSTSLTTLDPIMFTNSQTGRVQVSQLSGQDSISAFFDDATASPTGPQTCTPSQGGGELSGPDHQTLGGGVYPTPLPASASAKTYPQAVYYCSQAVEADFCSRSDNGGLSFVNTGQPPFTTADGCGGLHGHVRVGPTGDVYLPNKNCGTTAAVSVSHDGGTTFTVHPVTGSTVGSNDPSVSADRAGKIYYGYTGSDGHPGVETSTDGGITWSNQVFPGDAMGIQQAAFPEVIAGDSGRAAIAFLGSTTGGDSNNETYGTNATGTTRGDTYTGGIWHLYVAITTDGGQTYKTVDVTPTDPVQRGEICTNGTTCTTSSGANTRNLLDFMDITVDKTGHVLVGYADGCTGACVSSTKVSDNSLDAQGTIARQLDGPLLFAGPNDGTTPTGPTASLPEVHSPVVLLLVAMSLGFGAFGWRRVRAGRATV